MLLDGAMEGRDVDAARTTVNGLDFHHVVICSDTYRTSVLGGDALTLLALLSQGLTHSSVFLTPEGSAHVGSCQVLPHISYLHMYIFFGLI